MTSRLYLLILLGLSAAIESNAKATEPPPEAKSFIANALSDVNNTTGIDSTSANDLRDYFHSLLDNWDETLAKDPSELDLRLQPLQEAFQFYYKGRATITPQTEASLLRPPLPFASLAAGNGVDQSDFANPNWVLGGIRIRLAWLQLLSQQDPVKLLNDDRGLASVIIFLQTLTQLTDKRAQKALYASDSKIILFAIEAFPSLDDASIERLAATHDTVSKFNQPVSRASYYKTLFHALENQKHQFIVTLWQSRPDLFGFVVVDILRKLQEQLSDISKVIEALPPSPVQQQLVTLYSKRLNTIMTQFKSIPIQSLNENSSASSGTATIADVKLVDKYILNDWTEKSAAADLQINQFLGNPSVDPTRLSQMFLTSGASTPEADLVATILRAFSGSATPEVNEALLDLRKSIQDQQETLFQKIPTSSK